MVRRVTALVAGLSVAAVAAFTLIPSSSAEREPRVAAAPTTTVALGPSPAVVDYEEAYAVQVEVDAYLAAVAEHERQVAEYLAAIAAEEERQRVEEAERARRAAASSRPAPEPVEANYDPGDGSVWDALAQCESGGNWSYNGPSGYDGGLQFLPSTWLAWGGGRYAPFAWGATREQQIEIASGHAWSNWPACARRLGLL